MDPYSAHDSRPWNYDLGVEILKISIEYIIYVSLCECI